MMGAHSVQRQDIPACCDSIDLKSGSAQCAVQQVWSSLLLGQKHIMHSRLPGCKPLKQEYFTVKLTCKRYHRSLALHSDLRSIVQFTCQSAHSAAWALEGICGREVLSSLSMLGSGLSGHGQKVNRVTEKIC